ncbi:hypothetical protein EI94DRAFT_1787307 [Lactarius quietus]|nr:hypothetical protein EI94DRAFT_1787307 [Lactarius quietus]
MLGKETCAGAVKLPIVSCLAYSVSRASLTGATNYRKYPPSRGWLEDMKGPTMGRPTHITAIRCRIHAFISKSWFCAFPDHYVAKLLAARSHLRVLRRIPRDGAPLSKAIHIRPRGDFESARDYRGYMINPAGR